jgi:7-cyano-7-deazaguanine synthase
MVVETPLMWIDKAATWQLGHSLGGSNLVRLIQEQTHTCYQGNRTDWHDWGFGCGNCPACELRRNGFETYVKEKS